jgi:hypothetical protein
MALTVFSTLCLVSTARSDVLTVSGQTSGVIQDPSLGLSFTGKNPFSATTNAAGNASVDLGSFTYAAPAWLPTGSTTFTTKILINVPVGTAPGSVDQVASVSALAVFGLGYATINFDNTPLAFTFSNTQGTGSFNLALQDVTVWDLSFFGSSPQTVLWGSITNARVSMTEPFPVELLLSLLVGVGYVIRQRIAHSS